MIELQELLDRYEPRIKRGFLGMVQNMRGDLDELALERLIAEGRTGEALALLLQSAPNIATASSVAFMAAAQHVAEGLGLELGQVVVDFNVTNEFAINAMRQNNLSLVQGFSNQQTAATQQAIVEGIRDGANPRAQARNFRNSIGLSRTQVAALANYERALRNLSRDALRNKLRDTRSDRIVSAAINAGEALPEARILALVERYRAKLLAHRAEVIARTEALRSVHEGAEAMLQQAVTDGVLDADQISREWFTAKDERVRGSHRSMHGQLRPVGEPFVSGRGALLMRPGDARAPADETIQCRCRLGIRITVLVAA